MTKRSHTIHSFAYGWGRATADDKTTIYRSQYPRVFELSERAFRLLVWRARLQGRLYGLWRRLTGRGKIKLNPYAKFTTPEYSKNLDAIRKYHPDLRQVILDNSLMDQAADNDERFVTTVKSKTPQ